ncbi:MAG TPA: FIST N-terminal domain-containing protein [Phnomibacter sp.]|nr:FIST N-terminal domain-containing protein [Phnomibacter sp.]
MNAKTISGNSVADVNAALEAVFAGGMKPTLALVFTSIMQDITALTALFTEKNIQVFGATTGGEIADSDISHGGVSVLLMDMAPVNFQILLEDYTHHDPEDVARGMTEKALMIFPEPALLISNSIEKLVDLYLGETILQTICDVAGKEVNVWGGGAGDDLMFRETFVFNNSVKTNKGILMLVMNADKVLVKGRAASGMRSIGTEKIITRSDESWILEIDDLPATEIVQKYMGETLTEEDFRAFNLKHIFLNFMRENGSIVTRTTAGFQMETKGVAVAGTIKPGDKFRFTFLPDFEVLEEVSKDASEFQKTEMQEADALVMFSCIGRIDAFGPMTSEELQGIQSAYNVPMAGFFTYGEYGRATGGNNEFHNMTCCWVAIKEL